MSTLSHTAGHSLGNPDVRRSNLGLVLRHLRDHGARSRAALAVELGMTRSTVSTLITELIERGLASDGPLVQNAVGRPSTAVELDGRAVCGIGAEINVNHVSTMALDLRGQIVEERKIGLDARSLGAGRVIERLVDLVQETVSGLESRGAAPVGLTVGVAGLYDQTRDVLTHGPNLGWYDVPVGTILRDELDGSYPVVVDNEGNLAAAAEVTPGDPSRQDILVLHGEIGVGGGIVTGGRLLRGSHGYAGEFGHMIVDPRGRQCGCGRQGCWETVSGLRALIELAADPDDPIRNPGMDIDARLAEINRRADLADTRTLNALDEVGSWVGVGASILANALNPTTIVLTGYYAAVGHHMRPAIERELRDRVVAPGAGGTRVELSTLGFGAAVRGGATASLESVFADPTRVPRRPATGEAQ
ncbi:putative NBD/HSP70 family sugar kinase [Nocardioides sp. J9]|uniref:ROK family transcriptional regulator n=1 Tax=Nocardioides sp. J9 TaxID=935844 RepID=UPI0011AC2588|nr:ROK family transcriptional regulator [Nocardioides sp. J9]TWG99008.1 putative NBD/HSP70 family sugar kinase [Nocardioides sp. J9]